MATTPGFSNHLQTKSDLHISILQSKLKQMFAPGHPAAAEYYKFQIKLPENMWRNNQCVTYVSGSTVWNTHRQDNETSQARELVKLQQCNQY